MDSPNPLFVLSIYERLNLPTGTSTSKLLTRSNFFRAELAAEPPASGRLTSIYWHLSSFALTLHHSTTQLLKPTLLTLPTPTRWFHSYAAPKEKTARSILSAQHPLPPVRLRIRPPKPDYARPTVLPECQPFHDAFPRRRPRGTVAFTPHLAGWKSLWRERGGRVCPRTSTREWLPATTWQQTTDLTWMSSQKANYRSHRRHRAMPHRTPLQQHTNQVQKKNRRHPSAGVEKDHGLRLKAIGGHRKRPTKDQHPGGRGPPGCKYHGA